MKISIQGEKGCFHEVAARQFFCNEDIEIVPCSTFDQTLNSVREGNADLAIMAIENARSGSILYNYSLIRESGLKMLGEHNLRVRAEPDGSSRTNYSRHKTDQITSNCPVHSV